MEGTGWSVGTGAVVAGGHYIFSSFLFSGIYLSRFLGSVLRISVGVAWVLLLVGLGLRELTSRERRWRCQAFFVPSFGDVEKLHMLGVGNHRIAMYVLLRFSMRCNPGEII